jgi:hypothetical protein
MQSRRARLGAIAAAGLALALLAPGRALAFTSVEGALIGDQGFFWMTPGQVWIFAHTLGNIDNRVMLQVGAPPGSSYIDSSAFQLQNQLPIQNFPGGGFVLEPIENINVGLWISAYQPNFDDFVADAIAALNWNTYVGDGAGGGQTGELQNYDPYDNGTAANNPLFPISGNDIDAGRKLDLFASYWMPELNLETGAHLWYGSSHFNKELDDSTGPIDIDEDSNPTTGDALGAESNEDVGESKFKLREFGLGLGGGYTGIANLRADAGVEFGFQSISWDPGGVGDYLDAGGSNQAINLRAHYALNDRLTVGGFFRFARQGLGFEPKKQRDGGDLKEFFTDLDDDQAGSLNTPGGGYPPDLPVDPTDPDNAPPVTELLPVEGSKFERKNYNMQISALARYAPTSRIRLYGATGFVRRTSSARTTTCRSRLWRVTPRRPASASTARRASCVTRPTTRSASATTGWKSRPSSPRPCRSSTSASKASSSRTST